MPRTLILMVGFVLLLSSGLSMINARESAASVQAATKACIEAATARAAETRRLFGTSPLQVDYNHCSYVQQWDANKIVFAIITLAGGLGLLAFGSVRGSTIA